MEFFNTPYKYIDTWMSSKLEQYFNIGIIQDYYRQRLTVSCPSIGSEYWFRNWQTELTLFPLLYNNPNLKLRFILHAKLNYTTEQIQAYEDTNTLPSCITPVSNTAPEGTPTIKFIHVKNSTALFRLLDRVYKTEFKEEKHLSLGLQINRNHKIRVYSGINLNTYTIITDRYDWQLLRRVITLIPKIFSNIKTTEVIDKILANFDSNFDTWEENLIDWYDNTNLKEEHFKNNIKILINEAKNTEKRHVTSKISQLNLDIDSRVSSLTNLYKDLQSFKKQLQMWDITPDEDSKDLTNYLLTNKAITNYNISGSDLYLNFTAPLVYYEEEALQVYYKSPSSLIHVYPKFADFFDYIFLKDNNLELLCETGVRINFSTKVWEIYSGYIKRTSLQHPHLMMYNCWGNNKSFINKMLIEGNYIGAIEQMIAAAKNINFTDSIVIRKLLDYLYAYGKGPLGAIVRDSITKQTYTVTQVHELIKGSEQNEADQDIAGNETTTTFQF